MTALQAVSPGFNSVLGASRGQFYWCQWGIDKVRNQLTLSISDTGCWWRCWKTQLHIQNTLGWSKKRVGFGQERLTGSSALWEYSALPPLVNPDPTSHLQTEWSSIRQKTKPGRHWHRLLLYFAHSFTVWLPVPKAKKKKKALNSLF